MRLTFVGIDPNTEHDECPAVFVDEETGDFVFQGGTVTDPAELAKAAVHSPLGTNEAVVRLPARMAEIIMEAANGTYERGRQGPGRHP